MTDTNAQAWVNAAPRMYGTTSILQANARHLPLADNTVDLIVTSPPYFALRSYTDNGQHYDGQIGSEATPTEFLDALLKVTAECARVLKPSGSMFVNLGDKYAGGGQGGHTGALDQSDVYRANRASGYGKRKDTGFRPKTLLGLPWRYAIRCIDELGLILRAEIIWSKPNGLPESVTDRVRRSHEQWFHFTLQPRYYSAVDEIRELYETPFQPLGKLPGSVWTVPTEPLTVPADLGVDHFAAFPLEWPRRIIQGWSPREVCTACGEGRSPFVITDLGNKERCTPKYGAGKHGGAGSTLGSRGPSAIITGYTCACPDLTAPATPGVVLDPFGGTGTTALAAKALGRIGIHVDMSADYNRIARWRCTDRDQLAKALGITRTDEAKTADTAGVEPLFEVPE